MPKQHDKIATRLAIILTKLNDGEKLSIDNLADEFNVAKRTIQRDLNERFSYLPIKKENGLYFLEEYCLRKLNFEDIKNFASLSGIKKLYPSLDDNFIVDLLNTRVNQNYIIKGYEYEDTSSLKKEFELINIAIVTNTKLQFTYNDNSRIVSPYKLVNTDGIWYLVADENGTLKTYTFTKLSSLSKLKDTFIPNEEFIKTIQQNKATWFSQTIIDVTLQIDISVAEYFLRRKLLPNQTILEQNEEYITISTKVSYEEEILKVVRYWIPNIKIIEPISLQEKLENKLKEYLNI
ncbi:MAG: WYL domain-containing protein [Campylobacterota bacterium]|nr:WYL domain-containing protein [Campylobacterota bacterium]